jgi:ubiquinone/menaquinone biosynthesis C-methylase UbiE
LVMIGWSESFLSLMAIAFTVLIVRGHGRLRLPRSVNIEGIEDEEAVRAYDRISRTPQFKILRRNFVKELKRHEPRGTLADIGCGPGYLLQLIANELPELRLVGVEISEEMIHKAADNFSACGLDRKAKFKRGDVENLPFNDDSLDFIVSTLSLHHWPQPKRAFLEIYRVLKPNGQFLLFDLRRDPRRWFFWLIRFAQKVMLRFFGAEAIRRLNEPTGSVLASYIPSELKGLLSETKFKEWKLKEGAAWMFLWGIKA